MRVVKGEIGHRSQYSIMPGGRDWSVREAFVFGWEALPAALTAHWRIYLLLAAAAALVQSVAAPSSHQIADYGAALALFPALVFAMRRVAPDFHMTGTIFAHIFGLWIAIAAVMWATIEPLTYLGRQYAGLEILALALLIAYLWLEVKLTLAIPLYVLREGRAGMGSVLRESLHIVSGNLWWMLAGLCVCVWLSAALLPEVLAHAIQIALPMPGAGIIAAFVWCAGNLVFHVWFALCVFGIAWVERPEDAYAV